MMYGHVRGLVTGHPGCRRGKALTALLDALGHNLSTLDLTEVLRQARTITADRRRRRRG